MPPRRMTSADVTLSAGEGRAAIPSLRRALYSRKEATRAAAALRCIGTPAALALLPED